MPKNQFQRPLPVKHDHKVPRHGAAIPAPKPVKVPAGAAQQEKPTLPSLETLLNKIERG